MMLSPKSRRSFFGLILVALIFSALLIFVNGKGKLKTDSVNSDNDNKLVVAKIVAKAPNNDQTKASVLKQKQVFVSTPQEHDQLVISPTLEGTSIDGALKANSDGYLILDIEVRDFFDYFLSIADEVGAELAIAEIQRYAQQYLPEPANTQALELLGNYLRYKQTEFQIQQTPITQETFGDSDALALLRTSFDELKQKRQTLFNAEQDRALFSLEDSYANHTLSSLELMADEGTTDEQKRAQLEVLESELPAELSASFAQTRSDRQRQKNIEAVLSSTADDVQVYEQLHNQGLGQQQIGSTIERRQQQRHFDGAYQRYQNEKLSLDKHSATYHAQLSELQNRFFISPESLTQAKLRDLNTD